MLRRLTVFVAAGYLTNTLSAANREQSKQYRELAEQLSEANRNLREAEAAMRQLHVDWKPWPGLPPLNDVADLTRALRDRKSKV